MGAQLSGTGWGGLSPEIKDPRNILKLTYCEEAPANHLRPLCGGAPLLWLRRCQAHSQASVPWWQLQFPQLCGVPRLSSPPGQSPAVCRRGLHLS